MGEFSYQISVDQEHEYVYLVVKGEMDKKDGRQVIIEARAKAAETGLDILCDIREAEIIARPADWFFLFRDQEVYPSRPNEKSAILVNPEKGKIYGFVGNVTRNLGMQIQIFFDEDKALKWLKSE